MTYKFRAVLWSIALGLPPSLGAAAATPVAGKAYEYSVLGDPADVKPATKGGFVLMGGGAHVRVAFQWMIEQSGGGDFVVLGAADADATNSSVFGLGKMDSLETIVFKTREAANDPLVLEKIRNADAIFLAGGQQSNYLNFW